MPHESAPHPTGLARHAYHPRNASGSLTLTPEIHAGLCDAIKTHPSLQTAAHSQGVSVRRVHDWVRRGSMPGAHPALAKFALEFAEASAAHARDKYREYNEALQEGEPAKAATILKYIDTRYPERNPDLVENAMSGKGKRSDNLEELLLNPTPRLLGLLQKTGWVRREVVTTTGEPKAEE